MVLWEVKGTVHEYDPNINETKPSTAYIDMATFDNIENQMYGGPRVITYFLRETKRSTWFTQIPIKLKSNTAVPKFGEDFRVKVSRTGDYLLNTWLRVTLDAVSIYNPSNGTVDPIGKGSETITWTPNFMHNLVEKCSLTVNDMKLDELYSEHLDFYSAFMIPSRSRIGYNRMIGNFTSPNNGLAGINVCGVKAKSFTNLNTAQELFLPLPFFFSKDASNSLPMAALPFADIQMHFKLRNWDQLLSSIGSDGIPRKVNNSLQLRGQTPTISNVQVWGNYAIVSNRERKLMGCNPRDMIIEQSQQIGGSNGVKTLNVENWNSTTSVDLRLNGAVKALFFGTRNQMGSTDTPFRSNYTTSCPSASDITSIQISASGGSTGLNSTFENVEATFFLTGTPVKNWNLNWYANEVSDYSGLVWGNASDIHPCNPIGTARLNYENSLRFEMESLYYSLIQPFYHGRNVPDSGSQLGVIYKRDPTEVAGQAGLSSGYHMYSYALKASKIDPCGSTNYEKLKNATLTFTPSKTAVNGSICGFGPWKIFVSAINNNILRISGGGLGFPLL